MSISLVAFPDPLVPATSVRGTLLGSSLQAMRERSLERQYFELLPEPYHAHIRSLVAMSWLEMDVALAHYRVMGAIVPVASEQRAIGRTVADRVHRSYLATVIRALRATGLVSPRMLMLRMPTIWNRVVTGGGVQLREVAPNDFEVQAARCALFGVPYFREGWAGVWEASLQLLTPTVRVDRGVHTVEDGYTMHVSWRD